MAELVGPKTWRIQGRRITLPVTLTDAQMSAAVFRSPRQAVAGLLDGTGLTPFTLGRSAFSMLMFVQYGPWELGMYDEVGVGVFVRGSGKPGLHLVDLPVTGAFTQEAGQDFWALPKWLMSSTLTFLDRSASITVHDGSAFVLRAALTAGRLPIPLPIRASIPAWSYLGHGAQRNTLLRGTFPMTLQGLRLGRGTARITLGDHPMAHRMAALGMTRAPLITVHARNLSGPLDAFDAVDGVER